MIVHEHKMCYNHTNTNNKEVLYMCILCKIVNGEIPSNTVHENEHFLAFHDIYPKAPIHILVIPKVHISCFQEVTPDIMIGLTSFIQEVATKMGLNESGYRLITNNGKDGGQEIFHLHFHLLGGGKLKWDYQHEDTHKNM